MKLKDFKLSTLIAGFLGRHWLMAGHLQHQWKILLCNLWTGHVNTRSAWFVTPQHLKEEQRRKVTHLGREPFRLRARTGNNHLLHAPILASVDDSGCEAGHDNMGVSAPIGALTGGDWEQFLEDSHTAAFLLRKPVTQHILPPGQLLVSWQALRFVLQQLVRVWDPNVIKTAQNSLKWAVSRRIRADVSATKRFFQTLVNLEIHSRLRRFQHGIQLEF